MSLHVSVRVGDPASPTAPARRARPARLLIGLLVLIMGFLAWREFEPILLFRPVDGVVVWSEVGTMRHVGFRRRRRTRYVADVTYRYEVNGERFLSSQYRRTNMAASRSAASRRARRYVRGTRVPAWYNPLNPADAVLSRAPNLVLIGVLGFAGVMWLYSLALAPRRTPGARTPPMG